MTSTRSSEAIMNQTSLFHNQDHQDHQMGLLSCFPANLMGFSNNFAASSSSSVANNNELPALKSFSDLLLSAASSSSSPLAISEPVSSATPEITTHLSYNKPIIRQDISDLLSLHRSTLINPLWAWGFEEGECKRSEEVEEDRVHNNNHQLGVSVMKMKRSIMKGRRKVREPRFCFKTLSNVDVLDDGYKWRKYGQKVVKNTHHPRSYYRCTQDNCRVKKRVERLAEDPRMVITTYEGRHAHSPNANDPEDSHPPSQLTTFLW